MSRPTAYRETRSLLTSLARAGWGELGGGDMQGTRSVLAALVSLLPWRSGAGLVTVAQVADAAGLRSLRWTAGRLHLLADLGVITWTPGGVIAGRPLPGHVRIIKAALVELIDLARPALHAVQSARRAATLARIRGLIRVYSKRQRHKPLSVHASLSDGPHPLTGESPTGDDSPVVDNAHKKEQAMVRIPCEHHRFNVCQCRTCTTNNTPPAGFEFIWAECMTCGRDRTLHDKIEREEAATSAFGVGHMFQPYLSRLL